MKKFFLMAAVAGLAACDSRDPAQSEPAQTETLSPTEAGAALPPPQRAEFAAAWAEACPEAEPVGRAFCKSLGLAEQNFTCDYGLGNDEDRRHTAELAPGDGKWVLADPANACSAE